MRCAEKLMRRSVFARPTQPLQVFKQLILQLLLVTTLFIGCFEHCEVAAAAISSVIPDTGNFKAAGRGSLKLSRLVTCRQQLVQQQQQEQQAIKNNSKQYNGVSTAFESLHAMVTNECTWRGRQYNVGQVYLVRAKFRCSEFSEGYMRFWCTSATSFQYCCGSQNCPPLGPLQGSS